MNNLVKRVANMMFSLPAIVDEDYSAPAIFIEKENESYNFHFQITANNDFNVSDKHQVFLNYITQLDIEVICLSNFENVSDYRFTIQSNEL